MEEVQRTTLEKALAKTEEDAIVSLKASQAVVTALRRFHRAAKLGTLKELSSAIESAEKAELALRQQIATSKDGWDFSEDAYFLDGSFVSEILATAEKMGVRIYERDDRLYCYPVLVRVLPVERAVQIDKTKERSLRPGVLVNHLRELQKKPPRFRPEVFLEALYSAYQKAVATRGKELFDSGPVIALMELYELFTLLPGQSKEYSRQEFARDIYLLHKSDVNITKKGSKVTLVPARSKFDKKAITALTEMGEERYYYGISFTPTAKE